MNLDYLEEKINKNEIHEAICIIQQIAERKLEKAVPFLIEQLEITDNNLLRNAIALALSDMKCEEAVEPIIRMLKHPKTKGFRGSLLSALEPFDYLNHLDTLVDFMCKGNFEVSRKSFLLIEHVANSISAKNKQKYIKKVRDEIDELQDRVDFLTESLDIFIKE